MCNFKLEEDTVESSQVAVKCYKARKELGYTAVGLPFPFTLLWGCWGLSIGVQTSWASADSLH